MTSFSNQTRDDISEENGASAFGTCMLLPFLPGPVPVQTTTSSLEGRLVGPEVEAAGGIGGGGEGCACKQAFCLYCG